MKRSFIVALVVVLFAGLGSIASAANSLKQNAIGMSVGIGSSGTVHDAVTLSGRYFLMDTLAGIVDMGFESHSGDQSNSYALISLGARKYLGKEDFAPFAGGSIIYERQRISGNTEKFGVVGVFGAEYFFHKQFSVEGSAGLGIERVEDNARNPSQEYTSIGTTSAGVKANFYF